MRRVRKEAPAHQRVTGADAQVPLLLDDGTVMLSMIQALIPLGLAAVKEALQRDVVVLAGARYAHHDGAPGIARWGHQRGSIYLADQKLAITVPRARPRRGDGRPARDLRALANAARAGRRAVSPRARGRVDPRVRGRRGSGARDGRLGQVERVAALHPRECDRAALVPYAAA